MTSLIFADKRTRSQLTLPDDILFRLSQRSPLKDARTALKNNNLSDTSKDVDMETVEDSEDEILLSPGKLPPRNTRVTKRSVSPLHQDEYAARPESPSDGRGLKRLKREGDSGPSTNDGLQVKTSTTSTQRSAHFRSFSQPDYGKASFEFAKDASMGKGRAQSVPLFPQPPTRIVHIDLRNPPPSPRRPRSRSPSKERELRIVSEPPLVAKLDPIPDELDMQIDKMVVDQSSMPPQHLPVPHLTITAGDTILEESAMFTGCKTQHVSAVEQGFSTPTAQGITVPFLSPLTPLPETPYPTKHAQGTDEFTAVNCDLSPEEKSLPLALEPFKRLPSLEVPAKSKLPRPSQSNNVSLPSSLPPTGSSRVPTLAALATKQSTFSDLTHSSHSQSKGSNAFTVMMEKARGDGEKRKKAEGQGVALKSTSSTRTNIKAPQASRSAKRSQKGKEKEIQQPTRSSIKSQMKPKGVPKPKLVVMPRSTISFDARRSPPLPASSPVDIERPSSPSNTEVLTDSTNPAERTTDEPSNTIEASVSIESLSLNTLASSPAPRVSPESLLPAEQHSSAISTMVSPIEMTDKSSINHSIDLLPIEHYVDVPPSNPIEGDNVLTSSTIAKKASPTAITKLPTRKTHPSKRMPASITPRMTRSSSLRQNQKMSKIPAAVSQTLSTQAKPSEPAIAIRTPTPELPSTDSTKQGLSDGLADTTIPLVSPESRRKSSSPTPDTLEGTSHTQLAVSTDSRQTFLQTPSKPKPTKSATPSPTKLGRSVSMYTSHPTKALSRAISEYSIGSSLSTLSSALEKLHQPPPGRPNTSMGFNRDDIKTAFELQVTSKDDGSVVSSSSEVPGKPTPSSSQAPLQGSHLVQRTLIGVARSSTTGKSHLGTGAMMRGTGGFKATGKPASRFFGFSGGAARTNQKASRKTSLPSVAASPVKGGDRTVMDTTAEVNAQQEISVPTDTRTTVEQTAVPRSDKGDEKQRPNDSWLSNASRRVSLASQALTHSLSAWPPKDTPHQGLMGPPATPTRVKGVRGASSSSPSSPLGTPEKGSPSIRMSLRNSVHSKDAASGNKVTPLAAASRTPETRKILKDCIIFVDVRTDDGEEAGSLFVEMLEGVGARILTRVGQTCTHIVFKNGLMSTLTRYRLLRDPKPLVVGIAWVVECVEQMKQVDETKFLIDLEGINVSGTNKRRRSMLPKMITHESNDIASSDVEGDVSMDGSTSSIALDDGLTPLERARRRKAIGS